jgi:hypothetical protein
MKGRSPTKAEKAFHDALCRHVGCVACRKEGRFNDYVSVHHIDGRSKKNAHMEVLPLCGPHHQDDGTAIAVHPNKAQFEKEYGSQYDLLAWAISLLPNKEVFA